MLSNRSTDVSKASQATILVSAYAPGTAPTLILIVVVFGDGAFGRQLIGEWNACDGINALITRSRRDLASSLSLHHVRTQQGGHHL